MFTRCPSCRAAFSITDQQLAIASGMVRCGVCEHVFDARLYLFKQAQDKEEEIDIQLDATADTKIDNIITAEANTDNFDPESTSEFEQIQELVSETTETKSSETEPSAIPKIIEDQVSSLNEDKVSIHPATAIGYLIVGLLLATLIVQAVVIYKEDVLPANIHANVCRWITCVHKVPRALNKIEILNRSIYTHPNERDALMVTVTIINRADFAQPYPIVELRFLDVAGDIMAARQFNPSDYFSGTWNSRHLMQAGRPVSLQLEVVDFGEDVVGYEFDFL